MGLKYVRNANTNLYGQVGLTSVESRIIDTEKFQRLKYIIQVGTGRHIFNATHTRYEHSLGCLYLTDKIIKHLAQQLEDQGRLSIEESLKGGILQELRIAALLHDLGHGPFSHSLELILLRNPGYRPTITYWDNRKGSPARKKASSHEDFTEHIILTDPEITQIFNEYDIESGIISQLVRGRLDKPNLSSLGQVISGDLDADRMDYILRDSRAIGKFAKLISGYIDPMDLIDSFNIVYDSISEKYVIGISEKRKDLIDQFFTIRYSFLKAIPRNPYIRIADMMLVYALEKLLQNEAVIPTKILEIFTEFIDYHLEEYLKKDKGAFEIYSRIERENLFRANIFPIKEFDSETKYNLCKISDLELLSRLESEIIQFLENDMTRHDKGPMKGPFFIDINISKDFPTNIRIIAENKFDRLYHSESSFGKAVGNAIFEEGSLIYAFEQDSLEPFLEGLTDLTLKRLLRQVLKDQSIIDMDIILMVLYALEKIGKGYFGVDDVEFPGPWVKRSISFIQILYLLKKKGIPFQYEFSERLEDSVYDDRVARDVLILSSIGFVQEIQTPAILKTGTYVLQNNYRITHGGETYAENLLFRSSRATSLYNHIQKNLKEMWEENRKKCEELFIYTMKEEKLRENILNADDINVKHNLEKDLEYASEKVKELRRSIIINMHYREDVF